MSIKEQQTPAAVGVADSAIRLERERELWTDRLRRYKIVIDGLEAGRIARGETATLPVTAGEHTVQLVIDWATSPTVTVNVGVGEEAVLYCGTNANPITALFLGILRRHRYLWLEPRSQRRAAEAAGT